MKSIKKLTDKQFVELVIDKELEIAGADVRYADMVSWPQEKQKDFEFYTRYSFKNIDEYLEWEDYFMEKFYEWQPKRTPRETAKREFAWFNLQWGLKYGFDYTFISLIKQYQSYLVAYKLLKEHNPSYSLNGVDGDKETLIMFNIKGNCSSLLKEFVKKGEEYFKSKDILETTEFKTPTSLILNYFQNTKPLLFKKVEPHLLEEPEWKKYIPKEKEN